MGVGAFIGFIGSFGGFRAFRVWGFWGFIVFFLIGLLQSNLGRARFGAWARVVCSMSSAVQRFSGSSWAGVALHGV